MQRGEGTRQRGAGSGQPHSRASSAPALPGFCSRRKRRSRSWGAVTCRQNPHAGVRLPFLRWGNKGTSLTVTRTGCQSQVNKEAGKSSISCSSQPPGPVPHCLLPPGFQLQTVPFSSCYPDGAHLFVLRGFLPFLFSQLSSPPTPPPNSKDEGTTPWMACENKSGCCQPALRPAAAPPRAGGYGNELMGMQMRLLGVLHGSSLGGAKMEQVGVAAGKPSWGPFPQVPAFSRPASPREGFPHFPGLCSARYLDSCWGLIISICVNRINFLFVILWCNTQLVGLFFLVKFGV